MNLWSRDYDCCFSRTLIWLGINHPTGFVGNRSLSATHSKKTQEKKKKLVDSRFRQSKTSLWQRPKLQLLQQLSLTVADSKISVKQNEPAETSFIIAKARHGLLQWKYSATDSECESDSNTVDPSQEEVGWRNCRHQFYLHSGMGAVCAPNFPLQIFLSQKKHGDLFWRLHTNFISPHW